MDHQIPVSVPPAASPASSSQLLRAWLAAVLSLRLLLPCKSRQWQLRHGTLPAVLPIVHNTLGDNKIQSAMATAV